MQGDQDIGVSAHSARGEAGYTSAIDQLSQVPKDCRWAVADEALLKAIALGNRVRRGPLGARLQRWLRWADRINLAGFAVLLVGLVELSRLMRRQGVARAAVGLPERVFVGFGAGSEAMLLEGYRADGGEPVMRLDQTDVSTFGALQTVKLLLALRSLRAAYKASSKALSRLPPALAPLRLEFLTFVGMRLGNYSYMLAWFGQLRAAHPQVREVCFLSADTPAYAAVATGMRTRFMQHGFVRDSLLLPDFDFIDALTEDELRHFQRRVPAARLAVISYPRLETPSLGRGILIASIYGDHDEMSQILPVLEWARRTGRPVWVRPHPRENRRFWSECVLGAGVRIEDSDPSFLAALQRLRPRLVFSWYSTALADALQCGIIPVTVSGDGAKAQQDLVYPLNDRALHWGRHGGEIQRLLEDDCFYSETLYGLRHAGLPEGGD